MMQTHSAEMKSGGPQAQDPPGRYEVRGRRPNVPEGRRRRTGA
jgi:hypothetical protein